LNRTQKLLLVALALVAALIAWIATRTRQAPFIPSDADHAGTMSAAACLECHGPEGVLPQGRNHPVELDCSRCHGRR